MTRHSLAVLIGLALTAAVSAGEPVRVHPKNPRYFEWRGKAVVLVTSGEHYGAVVNADFDYVKYLDTLAADGMPYTRVFAGSYIEPVGAFGIERNTLAPNPGRFVAPWSRSATPGAAHRVQRGVHGRDRRSRPPEVTVTAATPPCGGPAPSPPRPAGGC
jgi:hypothetical protein